MPQDTTPPQAHPHDSLFRIAFGQPAHGAAILQAILPPALAEHIDWTSLELRPGSFVDAELTQRHVDVLYRVRVRDSEALIHVLLEHQREVEPLMAYRLLRYCVRIWEDWLRNAPKSQRLPPIVPVVVHHSRRGWTAPTRLSECWALNAADLQVLAPHLPELSFILEDLSRETDQALLQRTRTDFAKLALLALKNLPDNPDPLTALRHMAEIMGRVFLADGGLQAVASILQYASKVTDLDLDHLRDYVNQTIGKQDTEAVMGMTAKQLVAEAVAEAEAKAKADMLLRLLGKKFGRVPEATAQRIRAAQPTELDTWSERMLDAQSLDETLD